MSARRPATISLPCPAWCVEDHLRDDAGYVVHRGEEVEVASSAAEGGLPVGLSLYAADRHESREVIIGTPCVNIQASDCYLTADGARQLSTELLIMADLLGQDGNDAA